MQKSNTKDDTINPNSKEYLVNNSTVLVTRICLHCGKEFKVPRYYGKGEYCSKECSAAAKKANNNVVCAICGKPFHLKQSQINRSKTKKFTCSYECSGKLRSIMFVGENNNNYGNRKDRLISYNNGKQYYRVPAINHPFKDRINTVYEHRYVVEQNYKLFDIKYFVLIDGKYYLKPEIIVHHKDENTLNNNISNLIPLTISEHISHHNRNKIIIRDNLGRISGVFKQGELLENHSTNDNQQPSINSNVFEGSTTNSRIRTDNAEDSNANTSALPVNNGDDIV